MAYPKPFPLASPPKPQKAAFAPDLSVRLICPDCRDPNPTIIEEFGAGDLVCGSCGLVLGDRIVDTRSEWQTFANDEGDDPSRDGGTGIARELQRAATRSQNSRSEWNLLSAFRDISSWCDQFSLPKTISDIAKQLYKRADEEKLLRGKPLDAVTRDCNPTHVSKKVLGQCYKALSRRSISLPGRAGATGVAGPEDLLVRYCNHLDLPPHVQAICKDIIAAAREHRTADGRSPVSIAGSAIYFACLLLGVSKVGTWTAYLLRRQSRGIAQLLPRLFFGYLLIQITASVRDRHCYNSVNAGEAPGSLE
ncbi:hypothetical protein EDB83DRAFT_2543574 [Lactarius deliciosus]|nr:hypothetical protein EDB83DRAFT_2543574 [Lactarius deliciosus]